MIERKIEVGRRVFVWLDCLSSSVQCLVSRGHTATENLMYDCS